VLAAAGWEQQCDTDHLLMRPPNPTIACRMDIGVWSKFLDYLSDAGLLTTKAQSREAAGAADSSFATLDGMRQGDAGEQIPRDSINAADLATNEYLDG